MRDRRDFRDKKASYETGVTMSAFEEELKPDIEASRIISDEVSMTVFCNTKVGPLKNYFSSYAIGF